MEVLEFPLDSEAGAVPLGDQVLEQGAVAAAEVEYPLAVADEAGENVEVRSQEIPR